MVLRTKKGIIRICGVRVNDERAPHTFLKKETTTEYRKPHINMNITSNW